MTYGEYHYFIKYSMKMQEGVWVVQKPKKHVPVKMSKEVAAKYYTEKLNKYWGQHVSRQ